MENQPSQPLEPKVHIQILCEGEEEVHSFEVDFTSIPKMIEQVYKKLTQLKSKIGEKKNG